MVKVLIAEDKPPILWSIKQKIINFSDEIVITGEAFNGEEALRLMEKEKPDMVFTDIKMPVMSGLELISQAKLLYPDIHYVIISGYDEFEYARQAMKLNVSDYILKPITQEAINDVLEKTVSQLKQVHASSQIKLLQDHLIYGSDISTARNQFAAKTFLPVLFCAGSNTNASHDFSNPNAFFWSGKDMTPVLAGSLPEKTFIWSFEGRSFNEMILLLGIPEHCTPDAAGLVPALRRELDTETVPITIVIGSAVHDINRIGANLQNLKMLLRKNLIFAKSSILLEDQAASLPATGTRQIDSFIENKLTSFIQANQQKQFRNELQKLLSGWEKDNSTQYDIENYIKYIANICCRAMLEKACPLHHMDYEIEELLVISTDYASLTNGVYSLFSQFFSTTPDSREKKESLKSVIDDVEHYMKENFAKAITINDIADMVKTDPCHLSKTFKSVKGISPMEYLTNLRINTAKELLRTNSDMMLKDVAEIVGYANQYYFSRIFKMVCRISPSEYRNLNG